MKRILLCVQWGWNTTSCSNLARNSLCIGYVEMSSGFSSTASIPSSTRPSAQTCLQYLLGMWVVHTWWCTSHRSPRTSCGATTFKGLCGQAQQRDYYRVGKCSKEKWRSKLSLSLVNVGQTWDNGAMKLIKDVPKPGPRPLLLLGWL